MLFSQLITSLSRNDIINFVQITFTLFSFYIIVFLLNVSSLSSKQSITFAAFGLICTIDANVDFVV